MKTQIPDAEIHFLTKFSYREIIEYNPYLTRKHYLKDNLRAIVSELKKENFDFILDLQNNKRSLLIRLFLHKKSNTFNKLNFEKWIFVNLRLNILPDVHIVDRYLEPVRFMGVRNDLKGLDYFISEKDVVPPDELPLTHLHGFIAIVIGAKHNTKKLPLEKIRRLCIELPYPIILLGGPEDASNGETIAAVEPYKIFNGCGKYSLNQSASILRRAKSVITHDTGLMHIAAAYRKKIISVWGNTVRSFGMYPYYGNRKNMEHAVEIKKLRCRPCSKLGYKKCPLGHFKCMRLIDENEIASLVANL